MSDAPIADYGERRRALDPGRSFIVQAPAGSGKTELLIQRYLVLLSRVEQPEEIAAITFTIKAAAEMRRRVLEALAAARTAPRPAEPHRALTWDSARAVLDRDGRLGWRLEENAARLRVQTMDALCASLTRQMPLVSSFGAPPGVVEDAARHYRDAARATLAMLDEGGEAAANVARMLEHLDGDAALAETLLAAMLARRDQWLRHGAPERGPLEAALGRVREEGVARVRGLWPAGVALPVADGAPLDAWAELCDKLLLKDKREWRKQSALAQQLSDHDELCAALHALRRLPPARYDDAQWQALGAMSRLLPLAVAQLKLVFAAAGEVDFAEIAQGALAALGEPQAPTDLLLALDYRIGHILVDEFQDTSVTQLLLLESLTAGWQPDDGRTLFLVGDPMQSIYRFRQAEVGLFLRARNEGLGGVRLEPLTLSVNFRSQADIVGWVNRVFARVLPAQEDYAAGAVAYTPCEPVHPAEADAVSVHAFFDADAQAEAQEVARLARSAQGEGSVAILVRSRPHLERIVPVLKAAGVRFRAIEIDPLERRQVVQDLLALARALAHPGDRLAWLAVLRAPWCGLTLADLHALCEAQAESQPAGARQPDLFSADGAGRPADVPVARDGGTVWQAMCDERRLARLSPEGRERLERARVVLAEARRDRLRGTLRERVERAWLALGGPAAVADDTGLEDAEGFLDFLERAEAAGDSPHSDAFSAGMAKLFASPDARADGSVQIMTIHKAKGLEFDTVIVPGLGSPAPKPEPKLLLWLERADAQAESTLLLAPIKESGSEGDPIYRYLARLEAEREGHEDARLLYVAATRAKKHLHLLGATRLAEGADGPEAKPPASGSLLHKLWPAVEDAYAGAVRTASVADEGGATGAIAPIDQSLVRLAPGWTAPAAPAAVEWPGAPAPARTLERIEFSWAGETARRVGSVVHRWLQQIAADALRGWDARRVDAMRELFRRELAALGVEEGALADASERVRSALERALADPRGRWLLGPQREARNEYRLTGIAGGARVSVVVDRTFVDDAGRRWIVDYKTSSHEGAGLEDFLDRERERYAAQLATYARLMGGSRPRLGLYFPLLPGWREWE